MEAALQTAVHGERRGTPAMVGSRAEGGRIPGSFCCCLDRIQPRGPFSGPGSLVTLIRVVGRGEVEFSST